MDTSHREEIAEWTQAVLTRHELNPRSAAIRTDDRVNFSTIQGMQKGNRVTEGVVIKFAAAFGENIPAALRVFGYDYMAEILEADRTAPHNDLHLTDNKAVYFTQPAPATPSILDDLTPDHAELVRNLAQALKATQPAPDVSSKPPNVCVHFDMETRAWYDEQGQPITDERRLMLIETNVTHRRVLNSSHSLLSEPEQNVEEYQLAPHEVNTPPVMT